MRLAAGAATAGMAYRAGRNRAEQEQVNEQAREAYARPPGPPGPYEQYGQYAPPPQAPPPPPPPTGPSPSALDQLERLAHLHESGAINDAEYAAMKTRLIGG